jgi:hypothetical protein
LVGLFRDALVVLTPSLTKAHIDWSTGSDAWDRIAQVLFEELVVEPVRWALGATSLQVPRYQVRYPTFVSMDFLCVAPSPGPGLMVFRNLAPNGGRFDAVACALVDERTLGVLREDLTVPIAASTFTFERRSGKGSESVARLSIPL